MTPHGPLPEWFSARQLAGLPGMPGTRQGVQDKAQSVGWQTRLEPTRGGRRHEYHLSSLPPETRAHLARRILLAGLGDGPEVRAGREAAAQIAADEARAREERRARLEAGLVAWHTLSAEQQAVAEARDALLRACEAFLMAAAYHPNGTWAKRGCQLFLEELAAGRVALDAGTRALMRRQVKTLSYSTLLRWRDARHDGGVTALAPGYRAHNRRATSVPEVIQQWAIASVCDKPHIAPRMLAELARARFRDAAPHEAALRRFVSRWKAEHKSLYAFLTNPDEWRRTHAFITGRADAEIEALNQLWEFDSTPADILCTDGRHALVGVVDVWSRRAKLQVTPTSRSAAIAALARRSILDWGLPDAAKTDNGQDYTAVHLCRVFASLDVEHWLCDPFCPDQKPHVESFFKTFNHGLLELCPGFIGHSVAERKDFEARKTFAARLATPGETIPVGLSSAELQDFCDRWTESVYHHNPHSGLGGMTPAERLRSWTGPVRRLAEGLGERALDLLLWEAPGDGGWRTVGQRGVRIENRHYHAAELAGREKERVQALLDPADLSRVCLYWNNPETGLKEFLCWAQDPHAPQADRAEFRAKVKAVQKEMLKEEVAQIRKEIKDHALETVAEEYLAYREEQAARVVNLHAHQVERVTTRALEEAARALAAANRQETDLDAVAAQDMRRPGHQDAPAQNVTEIPTRLMSSWMEVFCHLEKLAKTRPLTPEERERMVEAHQESIAVRQYLQIKGVTLAHWGI